MPVPLPPSARQQALIRRQASIVPCWWRISIYGGVSTCCVVGRVRRCPWRRCDTSGGRTGGANISLGHYVADVPGWLSGLLAGAVVTYSVEALLDRRRAKVRERSVLRGLRRSLSNVITSPPPLQDAAHLAEEGRPLVPVYGTPVLIPYLDEGIGITAGLQRGRELYLALTHIKRLATQINEIITSLPVIQTSVFVQAQPMATQMQMHADAARAPGALYKQHLIPQAKQALQLVIQYTNPGLLFVNKWFARWPRIPRYALYLSLRRIGDSRTTARARVQYATENAATKTESGNIKGPGQYHPGLFGELVPDPPDPGTREPSKGVDGT